MPKKPKKKTISNSKKTTSKAKSAAKLTWLPKKTFELEFTIPWSKVKVNYKKALEKEAKNTTLKGFRKGKAPIAMVEKGLDQQKLYQEVINQLLPGTYTKAVKEHNLRPIMSPKIKPLKAEEGKDWVFKATTCEAPEVKLGDYLKLIKGEVAREKIWTPKKGKSQQLKPKTPSYDQKLKVITEALTKNIKVEIPDILLDNEVSSMLSRLLDQIRSLGLTIEQYLSSKRTNSEKLRSDYRNQAENTLKLEFILQQIVADRKIDVKKEEVDKMIAATPDKKIRKQLNAPMQRAYVASIISKRKALDYLISL